MNGTITRALTIAGGAAAAGISALAGATAATAAPHSTAGPVAGTVAYVRAGEIYAGSGATEVQLTHDGGNARPRFAPDGRRLAYLHNGVVWVMNADGSGRRQVGDRPAGGASWSPDGRWLAFAARSCTGGPGVFRVAVAGGTAAEVLFPASCKDQEIPAAASADGAARPAGTLVERLRTDDAVAWSPDGSQIAFRGGECESIADNCLSVGSLATGRERAIDVYGGGGRGTSGFGVVPAWSADGGKVAWTTYAEDGTAVGVTESDASGANRHRIGQADDREMVYAGPRTGLLTADRDGHSWVTAVDLTTGRRTPLHQGSQPTVAR